MVFGSSFRVFRCLLYVHAVRYLLLISCQFVSKNAKFSLRLSSDSPEFFFFFIYIEATFQIRSLISKTLQATFDNFEYIQYILHNLLNFFFFFARERFVFKLMMPLFLYNYYNHNLFLNIRNCNPFLLFNKMELQINGPCAIKKTPPSKLLQ